MTAAHARQERATFFYAGTTIAVPALISAAPAPSDVLVCGCHRIPNRFFENYRKRRVGQRNMLR